MNHFIPKSLRLLLLTALIFSSCTETQEQFSIVLIPDTQFYSEKMPEIYEKQAKWIVENQDSRNIKFAIHLGDIVQHAWDTAQWLVASKSHDLLDKASLPYSVAPGNHDLDTVSGINEMERSLAASTKPASLYNKFFGETRFKTKSWYGGHYGDDNNNNYWFFSSGGLKFMVIGLEFAPRPEAIAWANDLAQEYQDHLVIVETHCFLNADGGYANCAFDLKGPDDSHFMTGQSLKDDLISKHKNIFMALSGHISGTSYNATERTQSGFAPVIELLTDYQSEVPLGNSEIGRLGNGWLRVLTFQPDNGQISVETISVEKGNPRIFPDGNPIFYYQRNDEEGRYSTDPTHEDHQFIMPFRPSEYVN